MVKEEIEIEDKGFLSFITDKIFPYVFIICASILFWPIALVGAYDTVHNLITKKSVMDEKSPHYPKIIVTCFFLTIISYGVAIYFWWFA